MAKIKLRRDTAANWLSANPVLALGEPGYDTTDNKIKIGDGTSTWTLLNYLTDIIGSGATDRLTSSTYSVILEGTTGTVSVPNAIISQGYQLNLAGSEYSYNVGRYLRLRDGDVETHLHLDTPDNSLYDIILGDDGTFVRVDHTGTVVIGTVNFLGSPTTYNTWTFSVNGDLALPSGNTTIGNTLGSDAIISAPDTAFGVLSQGSTGFSGLQWFDTIVEPLNVAGIVVNSPYAASTGSVQIYTGVIGIPQQYAWTFGADGTMTFPDATVQTTAWTSTSALVNGTSTVSLGSTGTLTVPGHVIPDTDIAYDLGSPSNRFRDIYVSSSTIYIGTNTVSVTPEGQMLVNGNDAISKLEYFGGEGVGPRDAGYIAWNTSTFTFNIPGKELLTAIYDLKPGNKIRAVNSPAGLDQEFTIVGNPRQYIRSGGFLMAEVDVAETTSTNIYAFSLYLPVKNKSASIINGTWTVAVSTTGTMVYPNGTQQTGASISIADLKTLVAASTDFADFKTRISAL